jgi:hypothetical protein
VAASLKNAPGVQVDVVDGAKGEFTVLVDGHEVAKKGENLPPVEDVLTAVRKAGQATAGARA